MKNSTSPEIPNHSSSIFPPLDSPGLMTASSRSSYNRGATPTDRHTIIKLQEQIKQYQEEIQMKEKIIEDMRKFDVKFCPDNLIDAQKIRDLTSEKEQVASLNVKITNLQYQIGEHLKSSTQKDATIESLKTLNSKLKEDVSRLNVALACANDQLTKYQEAKETFENLKKRNDVVINSLQNELKEKKDQLLELNIEKNEIESQLTNVLDQKDQLLIEMGSFKSALGSELGEGVLDSLELAEEIKSIKYEKKTLLMKIEELEQKLESKECEQQAGRQTIKRLAAKLEAEEADKTKQIAQKEKMNKKVAELEEKLKELSGEMEAEKCKITHLMKELDLSKNSNETKEKRIEELQEGIKNRTNHTGGAEKLLAKLMDSVLPVLEEMFSRNEDESNAVDWVIDCIYKLTRGKQSSQLASDSMNECIESKSSNISIGSKVNESIDEKDIEIDDLKSRLDKVNKELAHAGVVINGLNCDKVKYMRILTELSRVMKLDDINKDIGMDMITDALYARADQLQKLEFRNLTEQRLAEHGLQRRCRELEERLRSRDLHIDMLQKKIGQLEGKYSVERQREKERDREIAGSRRLAGEKTQLANEVVGLREEVIELKARLLQQEQLRVMNITLDQEVKCLKEKLDKLELIRQKQCKKLAEIKEREMEKVQEMERMKGECNNQIQDLNRQLQLTKEALEDSSKKEQQMAELRIVISKLLGLDMDTLSIPDYEIVNRLEHLVTAYQSNVMTAYSIDNSLRDLKNGFYHEPCSLYSSCDSRKFVSPIYPCHHQSEAAQNHKPANQNE